MKAGADIILETPAVLNASLYILPTVLSANATHSKCAKMVLCCSKVNSLVWMVLLRSQWP